MTAAASTADQDLAFTRRDWARGVRALRRLADDNDVRHVFTLLHALNGRAYVDSFVRLRSTPQGRRWCDDRLELAPHLLDNAWLDSLAPGTVGAAYRDFLKAANLSQGALIQVGHREVGDDEAKTDANTWFFRRMRDTHDIWHALLGYGFDNLGELCAAAFTYAQTKSLGWAWMAWGGSLRVGGPYGAPFRRAIREGFARGAETAWLPAEDYVALLAEPLEDARRRLGITPPAAYDAVPEDLRSPWLKGVY